MLIENIFLITSYLVLVLGIIVGPGGVSASIFGERVLENSTYQNLWNAANAVGEGKCRTLKCTRKQEGYPVRHLNFRCRKPVWDEPFRANASRTEEIIKMRPEVNRIENRQTVSHINKMKNWFLGKSKNGQISSHRQGKIFANRLPGKGLASIYSTQRTKNIHLQYTENSYSSIIKSKQLG